MVYLCVLVLPGRDDPELDTMLKERVRWGDPMAHLVKVIFSTQPLSFECIYSILSVLGWILHIFTMTVCGSSLMSDSSLSH